MKVKIFHFSEASSGHSEDVVNNWIEKQGAIIQKIVQSESMCVNRNNKVHYSLTITVIYVIPFDG